MEDLFTTDEATPAAAKAAPAVSDYGRCAACDRPHLRTAMRARRDGLLACVKCYNRIKDAAIKRDQNDLFNADNRHTERMF